MRDILHDIRERTKPLGVGIVSAAVLLFAIAWAERSHAATPTVIVDKDQQTPAVVDHATNALQVKCVSGCTSGTVTVTGSASNATDGQSTSTNNLSDVSYVYGWNGTGWDRLQVDGSKYLKINCVTGCGASGTVSNATDSQATTTNNLGVVGYNYGWNGTGWDRLQVDGSKYLKTDCIVGCSNASVGLIASAVPSSATYLGAFHSGVLTGLQLDASSALLTDWSEINGTSTSVGNGTSDSGTLRVAIASDNTAFSVNNTPQPSSASTTGIAPGASTAVEACHVFKASAGNLYGFTITTNGSATSNDYIQIFNATSAPADGAVTPAAWGGRISANQTLAWSSGNIPMYFSTGITVCLSSNASPLSKTADANAVYNWSVK